MVTPHLLVLFLLKGKVCERLKRLTCRIHTHTSTKQMNRESTNIITDKKYYISD